MTSRRTAAMSVLAMIGVSLVVAGCGGSSKSKSKSSASTPSSVPAQTTAAGASGGSATGSGGAGPSVTTGPVRGVLTAQNHTPIVTKLWPYTVTVTDANGQPLDGTIDVNFAFGGQVVGHATPAVDHLKHGRWHDLLTFPAESAGEPLALQLVVHTARGSITLAWPVIPRKK